MNSVILFKKKKGRKTWGERGVLHRKLDLIFLERESRPSL